MPHTTEDLEDMKILCESWKECKKILPDLAVHYGVDKDPSIKNTWERKKNPDASATKVLAMRLVNQTNQIAKAYGGRDIAISMIPRQVWRNRFRNCVRELNEQRKVEDIIAKDMCLLELVYSHGQHDD